MRRLYTQPRQTAERLKTFEISHFLGVDLASGDSKCAPCRSPNAQNIDFPPDKTPVLRPARRHLRRYPDQIYGVFSHAGSFGVSTLVHSGSELYLDAPSPVLLYEGLSRRRSFATQAGDILVITDGRYAVGFDGEKAAPLSDFAYIPTLRVSCPMGSHAASSGTRADSENLATLFVAEQFAPSGNNKTAYLLYKNVSEVTAYVFSNGGWVRRTDGLEIDCEQGKVTYDTAPTGSADCLRVVYKKPHSLDCEEAFQFTPGGNDAEFTLTGAYSEGSVYAMFETCLTVGKKTTLSWTPLSNLNRLDPIYEGGSITGYHDYARFFEVEGGTLRVTNSSTLAANAVQVLDIFSQTVAATRSFTGKVRLCFSVSRPQSEIDKCLISTLLSQDTLCVGQSVTAKNADYTGTFENGIYFKADGAMRLYGEAELPILGYLRLPDGTVAAVKKPDGVSPCLFIRNLEDDSVSVGAGVRGGVCEGGFCLCGNDPLFLASDGLYALQGLKSFWANEKYAVQRAAFIAPVIEKAKDLENAALFAFDGAVYLLLDGKTYVGRPTDKNYEWSVWDLPATLLARGQSGLICACENDLFTLENGEFDSDFEGVETPISGYLCTPLLTFGSISRRKTIVSAHVMLKNYVRSGILAQYLVRSLENDAGGQFFERAGYFDFSDVDFSDFHFSTDTFPQIVPLKAPREFESVQFRFCNLPGKPFGLENFSAEYKLSSKIRR